MRNMLQFHKNLIIITILLGAFTLNPLPTLALGEPTSTEKVTLNSQQNFAPMNDIQAFRRGIEQMAANTTSIKANFKQEKYLSILSIKLILKVLFFLKSLIYYGGNINLHLNTSSY